MDMKDILGSLRNGVVPTGKYKFSTAVHLLNHALKFNTVLHYLICTRNDLICITIFTKMFLFEFLV